MASHDLCLNGQYMGYSSQNGRSAKMSKSFYQKGQECHEIGDIRGEGSYESSYKATMIPHQKKIIREGEKHSRRSEGGTTSIGVSICTLIKEDEYKSHLKQATLTHDAEVSAITRRMMQEDNKSERDFHLKCDMVSQDKRSITYKKLGDLSVESFSHEVGKEYSHASLLHPSEKSTSFDM